MSKDLIEEIATTSRGQQEAETLAAGERELARLVALVGEDVAKAVNLRVEVKTTTYGHSTYYYILCCDYNKRTFKVYPPVEGESGLWTLSASSRLVEWFPAMFNTREGFAEALFYGQSTARIG